MTSIIDELFENAERCLDNIARTATPTNLSVEIDAANIACDGEDNSNEDENESDDDDDDNKIDGNQGSNKDIIVITNQQPLKICLANINDACFTNIHEAGRRIMEKQNPEVNRFNFKKRMERKMKFYESVHASLDNNNDSKDICLTTFLIIKKFIRFAL